jgi:NAD(P)-dependent dehydrogenase (short-subunit alcohol dehydrogenase family)
MVASALDARKPTVLITGASRGIGLGFARNYAERNWNVIATARNPDAAADLREVAERSENVVVEKLDVLDSDDLAALAERYAGRPIDVLINNAAFHGGSPESHRLGHYDFDVFQQYMAVNVFGPLKVSEAFIDNVKEGKQKKIVSLTTRLASMTNPPPFNAFQFQIISKTALNQAMRLLRRELKGTGILVLILSPGLLDTDGAAKGRACVAASLADGSPPPPPIPVRPVAEGVAAMVRIISELDASYDGYHMGVDGQIVDW